MHLALNATASSTMAIQLTSEALQRSATEEAAELLAMLVKVRTGDGGEEGRCVVRKRHAQLASP